MGDEVEFIYNSRLRARSISDDFHSRLTAALVTDFQSRNVEAGDEYDPTIQDDVTEYVPPEDASDIEEELVIEPNEILDSDEEEEEDDLNEERDQIQQQSASENCFYGKDGTKWQKDEPTGAVRMRQHNIMRFRPGSKVQNSIPIEVFKKFFTPNISFIIITQTNRHAKETIRKWNEKNPNSTPKVWDDLTCAELDAFLGILFASGVSHNNMQDSSVLWRTDALPIFRATMSYHRFLAISRFIRFDDSCTRVFRQQTDKAAPIRDIWNFMNENLAKNYEPHENITVDEQLFPYRGFTKFTQFIPSKPSKYGVKVWWACDSKTKYPLHGKICTGKDEGAEREVNEGENVLLQLAGRYANSGRTIVANSFFTTLNGTKRLAALGLAYVGIIRANKRCLPKEVEKSDSRPVLSSVFGFHDNLVSLCSYVPKKNKAVNLLSTVHYTKCVEGEAMKPEALVFYNANKSGIDCMGHYSTKRQTRRWTFAMFCNVLDVMAHAAYCICKEIDGTRQKDARRTFLNSLANTLVLANIENRMNNIHVTKHFVVRSAIESFFGRSINTSANVTIYASGADTLTSKRDCRICLCGEEKVRRKTRFFCANCSVPVCQKHSKVEYTCFSCVQNS